MAVQIRLARFGRTHRPYYRVVAIDERQHREGRTCEVLGVYDPLKAEQVIEVAIEKVHRWLERGAQYSDSVRHLLKANGYQVFPDGWEQHKAEQKAKRKAKRQKRKKQDPTLKTRPTRRALRTHQAKLKAARLAELRKQDEERQAAKAKEAEAEAEAPAEAEQPAEQAAESGSDES